MPDEKTTKEKIIHLIDLYTANTIKWPEDLCEEIMKILKQEPKK